MNDITSPLQSTSYTNKDFVSIYEELLDLTKDLSSKWDPSISNESDPGVILLKLNAIIADKCNYSIDKSLLECFPLSVTQQNNARQLFEQLGYYMHWYKSATTVVTVRWIGEQTDYSISIPEFTMVTDENNNIVYSLLGPVEGSIGNNFNIGSQVLKCSGNSPLVFRAIQGISVKYSIDGNDLITISNLDSNNRLYFDTTNIAENGIFINNAGTNNYSSWVKKDNLLVEELGNTYYKFGVSKDGNSCYLEFPDDVSTLFQDGINITYIKTDGLRGNISSDYLSKFYNDLTLPAVEDSNQLIQLNSDSIELRNSFAAVNGDEEESINDAYRGYKSTIGTFDTLVTLRDYINYINRSELVSNCFVCDRQNDIQTTYKIMSSVNDVDQLLTNIEEDQGINAFSLKLYLLQYVSTIKDPFSYASSFYLLDNNSELPVKRYIEDVKSIQHDYLDLLEPTATRAHICFFKNKFPVECTIIPQTTLTTNQMEEVKNNIKLALYDSLNAKKLSFGEDISYNFLYDIIKKSDNRIKNISLSNVTYNTFAVYYDDSSKITYNGTNWLDEAWNIVNPNFYNLYPSNPVPGAELTLPPRQLEIDINSDSIYYCTNMKDETGKDILYYVPVAERLEKNDNGKIDFDVETFYSKFGLEHCYEIHLFEYNGSSWTVDGDAVADLTEYGVIIPSSSASLLEDGLKFKVRLSLAHQFKTDVYVKSVLAAKTQFFIRDEEFDYKLRDNYSERYDNIEKIYTNVDIHFPSTSDTHTYVLRQNECLQFFAPNLIDTDNYSNYVIFEYRIETSSGTIAPETDYQLKDLEYFIFYWRENAADVSTVYKYKVYGAGTIIHPTFAIEPNVTPTIADANGLINYSENGGARIRTLDGGTVENGDMSLECASQVQELYVTGRTTNVLTSLKKISIKKVNQIEITPDTQYSMYWVLNETVNNSYRLFGEYETERLLGTGEYFFYTNASHTSYVVLGAGTKIIRDTPYVNTVWEVPVIENISELLNGISPFLDYFFVLPEDSSVVVVENQFMDFGADCSIRILPTDCSGICSMSISTDGGLSLSNVSFDKTKWMQTVAEDYQKLIYKFTYSTSTSKWALQINSTPSGDVTPENLEALYGIAVTGTPANGNIVQIIQSCEYDILFNRIGYFITLQPDVLDQSTVYSRSLSGPTLASFKIEYKTSDMSPDSPWNPLADLMLNNSQGWEGRSLLALNTSSKQSQILYSNQSLSYKTLMSDLFVTITGGNKVEETTVPAYYPCCILSSFDLYTDGGEIFDTYVLDDNGNKKYLSLYKFSENLNYPENNPYMIFAKDGSINFIFSPGTTSLSLDITLPIGDYILPLKNYNSSVSSLEVLYNGTDLDPMYESSGPIDLSNSGTYYLDLHVLDTNSHTLQINLTGHTVDSIIQIGNCFKYGKPLLMSQSNYEMIREWISYLDNDHVFKYDVAVPDTVEISNPTDPATFLNVNHIYNDFTICQFTNLYAK